MFKKLFKKISMNKVVINGVTIATTGNGSVSIVGGDVFIDGVKQDTKDAKEINISIEGNVENLDAPGCRKISVSGDVKKLRATSGDVEVAGSVTGGISCTSGDIEVEGNVDGDVNTMSGDVKCGPISGRVSTMSGDIKNKK